MDYLTYAQKTRYLLEMIGQGSMISLQQAAEKFGCSQSTVQRMIRFLQAEGHEIFYCRTSKRFVLKK